MKNEVASQLPESAKTLFFDITEYRVLGASRHINLICDIFEKIAQATKTNADVLSAKVVIHRTGEYLSETRGQASQAVRNAIDVLLAKLDVVDASDPAEFSLAVEKVVRDFKEDSERSTERIIQYASAEMCRFKKYLVFDYSSTVCKYVESLAGSGNEVEIYVPESRTINGGKAYAQAAVNSGLKTYFFPDAAMLHYLEKCDAVLIGAETFNPDGTVFNTIGSDILGMLCERCNVPYYVLTPLMKVDKRSMTGHRKAPVLVDLVKMYAGLLGEKTAKSVDFRCPELIPVDARYIRAYITEKGVIPAYSLYQLFM